MAVLYVFMGLFCSVAGFKLRGAECFMRQILYAVKHETADSDLAKDARDKRLLLFISMSLTVFCYGVLAFGMSALFRDMQERLDRFGGELWHGVLIMLTALLAGRFFYDFKLARQLKRMTPEQRQEAFGDGPALLTREASRSTGGMSTVASRMSLQGQNSPEWLIYASFSIFLVIGLVCFYLAIFGS